MQMWTGSTSVSTVLSHTWGVWAFGSMKWDSLIIHWFLYLRHLSGSAYEMLSVWSGEAFLTKYNACDYTYTAKDAAGFSRNVDAHLLEAAKLHNFTSAGELPVP